MSRTANYLEAAADRVMIHDLLARYALEIDHGTPEGFAATFTPDGIFEIPVLSLRAQGTEEITAFGRDLQATMPNLHHVMSNLAIDVTGDRATGRCELNEFMALPEEIVPNVQGWYEDEYRFDGEAWRIAHRRTFFANSAAGASGPMAEFSAAFFAASEKYKKA